MELKFNKKDITVNLPYKTIVSSGEFCNCQFIFKEFEDYVLIIFDFVNHIKYV